MDDVQLLAALVAAGADTSRIARLAAAVDDWTSLVRTGGQHGMTEPLLDAVAHAGISLPAALADSERHRTVALAMAQGVSWSTLARITAAVAEAGVRVAVLKGLPLAERLYRMPARRPSVDYDLLVREVDLDRAVAALVPLGFVLETGPWADFFRAHHHHVHLRHPRHSPIELHFIACRAFGVALAAEPILARAEPFTARGHTVLIPSLEDEIVYLAVHAASHRFERLGWLNDIKLLIERSPQLRWDVAAARAREQGVLVPLSLACALVAERFETACTWQPSVPALPRWRAWLAESLAATRASHRGDALARLGFNVALCASPAAGARFTASTIATKLSHEFPIRLREKLVG